MNTRLLVKCDHPLQRRKVALMFALDQGLFVRLAVTIALIAAMWWLVGKFIDN